MNETRLFCDNWEFSKNPIDTLYSDDLPWERVDIPHDWMIYQVKDLYETSTGWYRRTLHIDEIKQYSLRFDGVYMDSRVYINGEPVFEWKYGYSTFEFDITKYLHKGDNLIAVRADYRCPNTRWYSGAGIYRNVWLKHYEPVSIIPDGIYISAAADGTMRASVEGVRPAERGVSGLWAEVKVKDGEKLLACAKRPLCSCFEESVADTVRAYYGEGVKYSLNEFDFKIEGARKWDTEDPALYTAEVTLYDGDEVTHRECVTFGFRDMRFDTEKGFFLNGRHIKLHGVCEHHDNGSLGAAFNENAFRRKLEKLREMGVNALRTSHNMPDPAVLRLCDEMGFIVVDEAFDMWEMSKTEYDYGRFFKEWADKDVCSWVRRDRNHPCIAAWSMGNEIYDTHAGDHGQEIVSRLIFLVRKHDPRKNAYVTVGSNYMEWENARKCADIIKLAGYNYGERFYDDQHRKYPDWMIYGSETASTLQSRGIYHFPLSQTVLADDDKQCSSLGNTCTAWGAKNSEYCILMDRDRDFVAGQFIWTGFDYIGEPTPYDTKNSYFGQIDTAGYPKDSAYLYRACWVDYKKAPFVHVFPYWDFTEGQPIDVRAASNCPVVKIFLNGKEIASGEIDQNKGQKLSVDTVVNYTKGEITAVGYDENGNELARDSVRSFSDAARIVLTPEKTELRADGKDLIYLDISMADKDGNPVANANNRVFAEVTGAGRLIGLDNGDSNDFEEYKGVSRRLFSGHLMAVIAAKDVTGDINVKVTSPSLPDSFITLKAAEGRPEEGSSYFTENKPMKADVSDESRDIPIRKIDFVYDRDSFDSENRETVVKAVVYPENTTVKDIDYRVTTVLGIDSNLGEIVSAEGGNVKIRCRGDGEFYLRAMTNNGLPQRRLISALRFRAEGVGAASFDPYSFITAGLHSITSENIGNGIQKGTAFVGKNSWFGFENVDFGMVGSDSITIPAWANVTTPVNLKIFDGTPETGELIADHTWHDEPIWMTYQDVHLKLGKKLKGMHTISFMSSDSYSVKGFVFDREPKEFAEINAADNTALYGDRFTLEKDAVTGIGNNVVLEFGEFDFSGEQPSAVAVCGRSALALNSLHLSFKTENDTQKVLCEFEGAEDYTERVFPVSVKGGKYSVSFTFLPGSDFDFRSFRFIK
ncbi:MAG: DUF4982 domain-containing protein [Oscillospiraceae bacterium]|nr:DUF4982 domain-containing protein [Oscillospiraceae bacterium]